MTGILWAVLLESLPVQPLFPNSQAYHVTLAYGVEREAYEHVIGLPVTVGVLDICHQYDIQAVRVVLPNWVPCQNPAPHITVSWVDWAVPLQANNMLAGEHISIPCEVDHVACLIEWLEWGDKPNPRKWSGRASTLCPTCLRQGFQTTTRSATGYCRHHRTG